MTLSFGTESRVYFGAGRGLELATAVLIILPHGTPYVFVTVDDLSRRSSHKTPAQHITRRAVSPRGSLYEIIPFHNGRSEIENGRSRSGHTGLGRRQRENEPET
jgi:hypothetical protein